MDGILIIDKPMGLTSHDVVARARRILKTKRIGHTGTLDPFATGVLVLLIGKATRLAQFLDKDEKEYEALLKFGYETDTGDRTGSPKSQVPSSKSQESDRVVVPKHIENVLYKFRGLIRQTPPMYSAKKVDGKKLYELARHGQEIEREPIDLTIHNLEIRNNGSEPPAAAGGVTEAIDTITLRVTCSAGTYIRTLAEDIARAAGASAHLQELRRTRAGKFALSRSRTLEELEILDNPADALAPMNEAVSHLPEMRLPADRVDKTRNGLSSRFSGDATDGDAIQMLEPGGELVAIGIFNAAENMVQPKVVLI